MLIEFTKNDGIFLDLRYAGTDNFMSRQIYDTAHCLLHEDAAQRLRRAIDIAAGQGCKLTIFDAFRPCEAQEILWQVCPNPDYIAPPDKGSNHSRGVAVDLGLCLEDGTLIDMGADFDELSPLGHHGNTSISPQAQQNRSRLAGIMAVAGFVHHPREWWHYQLPNSAEYSLLQDGYHNAPRLLNL